MSPTGRKIAVVVLLAGFSSPSCRHFPRPAETGSSSFVVVEQPRPPPPISSSEETVEPVNRANYREAQAIHPLVMPIYPPKALVAKAGAATVGVRVTVDLHGAVTDIRPSMLAISVTPSKFADEFRDAVELAVRQWKFEPARVHDLERLTEGEFTYDRVTRTEMIEAEFDLAFTFTTEGKVEAGEAGK
jgi:outer membrane biosynthesis protein TonB